MESSPHTHQDSDTEIPQSSAEGWGPIVGIIIIVALLIAGGIYFFLSTQAAHPQVPAVETESA